VYVHGVRRVWASSNSAEQPALLPVSAGDMLPANHLAKEIKAMVDMLDVSEFEAAYRVDGRGRPPYHPRTMLGLIMYCRAKKITSGREIAQACHDDLGARFLTNNRFPNRSTVDGFLGRHGRAIEALLPQTLALARKEDLLDLSATAGDGTKALANAAMSATVTEERLLADIAGLQQRLDEADAAWQDQVGTGHDEHPRLIDDDEPAGRPGPRAGTAAWRRVCELRTTLGNRKAALAYLREHPNTELTQWQDRAERDQARVETGTKRLEQARATAHAAHERRQAAQATGTKLPGSTPASVDDYARVRQAQKALRDAITRAEATAADRPTTGRVNTTDWHSQIMPGKHDGFDQRFNVMVLAAPKQLILAIGTHDSPNDKQALVNLLRQGRANLDAAGILDSIKAALFDSGFASLHNITADVPVELLLIATEKEARQTGRLKDEVSTASAAWAEMTERLNDPDNRRLYKRRAGIVEPVFAQLFARFGRYLNYRREDVTTELHLWAVTHNLLKVLRLKRPRPG
jgi:transposase